jgi:ABC-type thiamine transport system substrate-binding protein
LIEGAKSSEAGKRFIEFTLSEEGQKLLLQKDISRLPVLPAIYKQAPADYPNPFSGKIQAKVNFDSQLSESRYLVVRSLFDQMITFRHKELVAATKRSKTLKNALPDAQAPNSTKRANSLFLRQWMKPKSKTHNYSPCSKLKKPMPTPLALKPRLKKNGRAERKPITLVLSHSPTRRNKSDKALRGLFKGA